MLLVAASAKAAAEKATTLDERIELAMKSAIHHFMVRDEPTQFAGAQIAIWELSDLETRSRIETEARGLRALSAIIEGVPVDIEKVEVPTNPIGLLGRWRTIRAKEFPTDQR